MASPARRSFFRWLLLAVLAGVSLQLFFAARIALMAVVDPQSTAFQRSEMFRLLRTQGQVLWTQQWMPDEQISRHIKRAVIASEDAGFADHGGVEWEALENAWRRNSAAKERAENQARRAQERHARAVARALKRGRQPPEPPSATNATPKVIGGSTITQQLAKNLLLSSERNIVRKGQEFALTYMLEAFLSKDRILEIYLNNVEWGEGVFGIQAASRYYYRADASQLAPAQAARLAVMLPAPKRFEKNPRSAYVSGRTRSITSRMGGVELP